jgi:hypothetical protein
MLQPTANRRKGTVYLAVVGTAIIVGVIGIASIHVARVELREAAMLDDIARARLAARSGVEYALAGLDAVNNWRSQYESGTNVEMSSLLNLLTGGQSFEFELIDEDGDLDDDDSDPVTLRSVGRAGDARHVIEVTLTPSGEGLSCLTASVHADEDVEIKETFTTDQAVSSNRNIKCDSGGAIQGSAQAAGTISGSVSGTRTPGMTPDLELPEPDSVFDYYVEVGTPIYYGQLPGGKIEKVVLSANNNPFGTRATNPQGVYVINCYGNKVNIIDSRIQATLVFLNASTIEVEKCIHWAAFANNYPAVLVEGRLHLKWTAQQNLSESSLNVNFNPGHTPYENSSDNANDDTYPGMISGIVYATNDIHITEQCRLTGVLVTNGKCRVDKNTSMDYKSLYFQNPPPGFMSGDKVEILPGTWRQTAY